MRERLFMKERLLSEIDDNYIRQVLLATNNIPRYEIFSKSNQSLIKFASKKFTKEQIDIIRRSFVYNKSANNVGSMFREKNGRELGDIFIEFIRPVAFRKEFRAYNRVCDIAYLNSEGSLIAVEIKANGDKIKNAIDQCNSYSRWANFVYLLIEEKKIKELSRVKLPNHTGIFVFDGINFKKIKEAKRLEHEFENYLVLLNASSLRRLASKFHLTAKGKKILIRELIEHKIKSINNIFIKNIDKEIKMAMLDY
jgi:hypothetical protein